MKTRVSSLAHFASLTLSELSALPVMPASVVRNDTGEPIDVLTGKAIESGSTGTCAFRSHLINLLSAGVKVSPQVVLTLWEASDEIEYCFRQAVVDGDRHGFFVWNQWDAFARTLAAKALASKFPTKDAEVYHRDLTWLELHEVAGVRATDFTLNTYRAFRWDREMWLLDRTPNFKRAA